MHQSNSRAMLNERIRLNGAILFCGDCIKFKSCPKAYKDIKPLRIMNGLRHEDHPTKVKDYGWKPHKTTVQQYDTDINPSCECFSKEEK